MPTLDGIVVTEPKETEVYTFNRNDIKNIAKESIEQADKLELNPSGTFRAFENIVDKDGHKRFIEGDLETKTISGVSFSYAKWSLSGSHLLIVCVANVEDGTILTAGTIFANINIPSWIINKLVAQFSNAVDIKGFPAYDINGNVQTMNVYLRKVSSSIDLMIGSFTATADRLVRIAFDLLIDNE